jgi:anaerobic magnesium-protoporphyrin IX monomethyl ester cyclase
MTKKLDLVLINPSSRTQVYQSLGTKLAAIENPVWAGLMATYCRQAGLSVEIIDAEASELIPTEVAERVEDLDPILTAVVAYGHQPSASTQIMTACGHICEAVKQESSARKVLLVGGHVAALPERTLEEERADYVATGEGLTTLVALVKALRTSRPALAQVPGLCYRDGGKVRRTPESPLVANLDEAMPGVAWDLLPMDRYRAHNWHCLGGQDRQPYAALYTTLGCPYHCSFCCIQAPFKEGEKAAGLRESVNSYRFWSPDRVIEQIDTLVNRYGVRNIKIADEMFVLNKRHVLAICDKIIERGYDLNIWAYTRVDTIKDGMLDKLRRAGFTWLAVGIESGTDRVRNEVDKGFAQEDIVRVIDEIRAAGIHVIGNYIFGLPEDDLASMRATLDLARDLNCEFANFYSAMAYPGSPLYNLAARQGVPLPRTWTGYSQHSRDCLPLPTRHLPAREVLQFRDEAFSSYYRDPSYLQMVDRTFGPETVQHINAMTAYQLERDLLSGRIDVPDTLLPPEAPAETWQPVESLQLIQR